MHGNALSDTTLSIVLLFFILRLNKNQSGSNFNSFSLIFAIMLDSWCHLNVVCENIRNILATNACFYLYLCFHNVRITAVSYIWNKHIPGFKLIDLSESHCTHRDVVSKLWVELKIVLSRWWLQHTYTHVAWNKPSDLTLMLYWCIEVW